jgi:hypothetical protein
MLSLYRFILIILFIPCVLIFANTLIPGYGHTLYFDGSDDKVVVPYSEELNSQQYSIMFWIKPKLDESTTNPNGTGILSLKGKYGKKRGYYFIITDDKKIRFRHGNESEWISIKSIEEVGYNQWIHLASTFDGEKAAFYINGELINSIQSEYSLNNQEDLIIGYINQNYDYFKGYIEEISLWDRALSSEEIINNMNTLFSKEEENLVAYWHMDNVSNDNTKLANFLNDNHTGSLHGYTTQLNAPEFSWNKSEFKQLFFAIEDSLTHFNLYGYASNSEFFIPFISQNIRFGDLYITNPENMKLSFLSETNFNSERIQSSFPIEGTTPELISENGSLMFSYYLTSGDSTDFISVLDTALIFISSVNDAPTVVNPENTKDLLPVLVGSDNNLGTLISDIIENLIIHDPDHLLIDFEGGSTSFSHTQGDNYGIAVVAPLNNDDQLNEGNWEYLLNSSDSWTNLDLEEGGNYSLLLGQNDLIRYVPYSGTSGSRELTFRIWDQFNGEIGTYINLLENSGISDSSNDDISTHLEIIEGPPIAGFGNAFKFDGDGDYIEIHSLTSEFPLLQTNSWTVEMWVNSNVLDHEYTYLFGMREKNDNGSSDGYFAFGITNNSSSYPHKLFYYPNENNSHGINTNQTPFEHGVWNHLAVSFDGNTGSITLYANGISENTISSRASGFANGFSLIGAVPLSDDGTAYPHSFEGAIDEVRVWNYVRTSTQINNHKYTIYQSKPDGLIGHYRFDNINLNDETTKDDGGNNYNGKLNGDLIDNYLTTLDWVAEPELYFNPSTHGNFITLTGDKFSSFTQSTNGWKVNGNFIMSNGIAQYFKTNSDNTLPYTISIWIYPYEQTCTQYHENVIWGFYTQDGSNLSFLSIGCAYNASSCSHCNTNFRPKKLYFSPNGSTGYWTVNDVIYLNEWNYITITGDGVNQTQLYINGVEVNNYYTSDNPDAILTNFPIYMELSDAYIFSIGQDWDGAISDFHTSQHFTGGISEFVIWDSNLSVKEINEAMLGNIRTNNLLAHYLFNEGTEYNTSTKTEGITIVDNSGHSDFPDQNSPSRNGILYYDSIVNTVPLTKFFEVNEDQTLAENLQGYDEDSNIEEHGLNYYIITPPENGIASVVDATAGSISYTPNPNFNGTDILGYKISDNAGNSDSTITYIKVNPVNDAPVITKESITLSELGNSEILGSENIGQRVKDIISSFNIVTDVDIPFYIDISEVTGIAITSSTNLSANKWKYCFNCTDSSVYSDASSWNDLGTVSTSNALLLGPDDRIAFDSNGVSSDGSASLKFNLWDMTDGSSVNTYVNITSTGGTTAISTSTITVEQPIVEACVLNIPNIELPFLIPTDGSTSESITIQDGFDFFRIHLGGDDSFIVKWELDGSDTTGVDKFSFWGNSSVTIGEESDTLTLKLDLGTENDPGIIIHGNHDCTGYQLIQISMEINESFSYGGFTFSTNPDPFVFTYNSQEDQFEMSGTALFSYQGDSLTVGFKDFQNDNAPGMIIKNGDLEKLEVFLNTEFEIFGLDLTIDDVTFEYIHDDNYYAMWGEVDLIIENTDIIDISMGGSDNPGIIFQNGQLNYLNLDVISDIQAGKFKFETKDLDLIYTGVSNSRVYGNSINNSATAEYQITGEVKLVLTDGFTVDVTLGDEEDGLPGIDIIESNGSTTFELDFFDLTITSLELGAIDFKEVEFTYSNENGVEDFFAELDVSFSSKFEVDGTLEFEINNQGVFELDSLSIDWCVVGDNPGIEILGTGLELVHMGGGGSDFSDPANLSVNADVGLVLADQFEIDGTEVTLARSDDEVTITPNSLVLNADVLLGAY